MAVYPELAAAGLWTTSHDLATMVVALQNANRGRWEGPLSQAVVRDLFRPVGLGSFGTGFNVFRQGEGGISRIKEPMRVTAVF